MSDVAQQAHARLAHLEATRIPQLVDARAEEVAAITEDIRDELAHVTRLLNRLEVTCLDSDDAALTESRRRLLKQLNHVRSVLRSAQLSSKKKHGVALYNAARSELLGPPRSATTTTGNTKDDELMAANSNVFESLQRTMGLMRTELDRSVLSTQMLEQQTSLLGSTSSHYESFTDLLQTSKHLITSLERADIIDRLIIFGALLFFALVCAYILKKRIFDRGLRILGFFGSGLVKLVPTVASVSVATTTTKLVSVPSRVDSRDILSKLSTTFQVTPTTVQHDEVSTTSQVTPAIVHDEVSTTMVADTAQVTPAILHDDEVSTTMVADTAQHHEEL